MFSEQGPPVWDMDTSKGKTAVIEKIDEATTDDGIQEETDAQEIVESYWRVFIHNDDVHTFDYVAELITEVVPTVAYDKAYELCCTVHVEGIATITQGSKPNAERYCKLFQQAGLTSSISPESSFEGNAQPSRG